MIDEQKRIGSVHGEVAILVAKLNEIIRAVNKLEEMYGEDIETESPIEGTQTEGSARPSRRGRPRKNQDDGQLQENREV